MKNNSKKMRCLLLQILNLNEAAAVTDVSEKKCVLKKQVFIWFERQNILEKPNVSL